jgi:hypothetical protein
MILYHVQWKESKSHEKLRDTLNDIKQKFNRNMKLKRKIKHIRNVTCGYR